MSKHIKGVLGTKLGMTQVFGDDGKIVPVTVVEAGPCVVTAVRTPDSDGYSAVQLGYGEIDPRRVTKPVAGHFAKAGVTPAGTWSSCAPTTPTSTPSARRSRPRRSRPVSSST